MILSSKNFIRRQEESQQKIAGKTEYEKHSKKFEELVQKNHTNCQ